MSEKDDFLKRWDEIVFECRDCARRQTGRGLVDTSCPECGGQLVKIPPEQLAPNPDDAAVEVCRVHDMPEAEMIRGYLESEGIRVALRSAATWGVHTFTVNGLGEVTILALESDVERARKLVEQYFERIDEDEESAAPDQLDPEKPSSPDSGGERAVEIYNAADVAEAEFICAYLESEGIRVSLRSADRSGFLPITAYGMAGVTILALESEAERARDLIEQHIEQSGDVEQTDPEEPT